MTDARLYIQRLLEANLLRESVLRSAIQALGLPLGSRGLDIGCGIGLQAMLLADCVGPRGHITGLDIAPEHLAFGQRLAGKAGFTDRITFQMGDMRRLPFARQTFDWVWSADCIGYPLGELPPVLDELARVVRPGGRIAILAWSSQQLLPGQPLLEARLNATCSSYAPFLKGKNPELHFLRALRWLRQAGLEDVKAHTFVGQVQSPLGNGERAALASLFEMLWGTRAPEVSPQDWSEYRRLCLPESSDFVVDLPGYYAFFTYTMFQGKTPLE